VVLLGHPDSGYGSAFIISRKNRLLATVAHVADRFSEMDGILLAVPNDAAFEYRVERVWYHPALERNIGTLLADLHLIVMQRILIYL
jgi:hypothetical protein